MLLLDDNLRIIKPQQLTFILQCEFFIMYFVLPRHGSLLWEQEGWVTGDSEQSVWRWHKSGSAGGPPAETGGGVPGRHRGPRSQGQAASPLGAVSHSVLLTTQYCEPFNTINHSIFSTTQYHQPLHTVNNSILSTTQYCQPLCTVNYPIHYETFFFLLYYPFISLLSKECKILFVPPCRTNSVFYFRQRRI